MSSHGGDISLAEGGVEGGTMLPPIRRTLSKPPSDAGRSVESRHTGRTGGTKGTKGGKSRWVRLPLLICVENLWLWAKSSRRLTRVRAGSSKKPSSKGSASEIASQLRSMTRKTLSDGESGSVLSDGSHAGAERKRVRETVIDVYDKVLGRKPDPAGLSHYCACMLDGDMKTRGLIQQLCRSIEYVTLQEKEVAQVADLPTLAPCDHSASSPLPQPRSCATPVLLTIPTQPQVPVTKREWANKFHPWNAEPDEADEEVGTVRWVYNDVKANSRRWETGVLFSLCLRLPPFASMPPTLPVCVFLSLHTISPCRYPHPFLCSSVLNPRAHAHAPARPFRVEG